MKLNNKGFAITTILYTLLILFSLTLISIISGLNTRNKLLDKSIESIETEYNWECVTTDDEPKIIYLITAEKKGKYIYTSTEKPDLKECYTYLPEGTNLQNSKDLTFTTETCNNNKEKLTINGYCSEKE